LIPPLTPSQRGDWSNPRRRAAPGKNERKIMKNLKSALEMVKGLSDPYEALADAERQGEISLRTYLRACAAGDGLDGAAAALRENYKRAGVEHLCPV